MRSFFDYDSKLKALKDPNGKPHTFKRFTSLSALPFDYTKLPDGGPKLDVMIEHYKGLITRQLTSKFAVPALVRSDAGQLLNTDEALEGIPECYRHTRPHRSVLKLGLNVSAAATVSTEIAAMRCAAILAIWQLAKSRGQQVQFDAVYGYCGDFHPWECGHSRIYIPTPTQGIIKKLMASVKFRDAMIDSLTAQNLAGGYQLWYIKETYKLGNEFDFILDRLETSDEKEEYDRILTQIANLR